MTQHRLPFTQWSQRLAPGSDVLRNSDPHAVLLDHNLVAVTSDPDRAHDVARSLERVERDHALLTTIVYGDAGRRDPEHTVDPEGVTAHAGRRSLLGAIPGAIVGAVVIGLGVWLATDSTTGAVAAAVGGALFGAAVAAVWSFVIGTGQSEAFLDTFVDAEAADLTVIALHTDDPARVDDAVDALADVPDTRVLRVDGDGRTHPELDQPTRRSRPSQ